MNFCDVLCRDKNNRWDLYLSFFERWATTTLALVFCSFFTEVAYNVTAYFLGLTKNEMTLGLFLIPYVRSFAFMLSVANS